MDKSTSGRKSIQQSVEAAVQQGETQPISVATATSVAAAKRATTRTPIVFMSGTDPVAAGLVESLAKPGGRLTRVLDLGIDLTGKRLEILKEMMPSLRRVVSFYNPVNPNSRDGARFGREAARRLGVQLVERHVVSVDKLPRGLQPLQPRDFDAYY